MKRGKHVAVVGATGLVGQKMLEILEERNFPVSKLTPIASSKSAGKKIKFKNTEYEVRAISKNAFSGVEIALFSAGGSTSKQWAPIAATSGATVIDNSSAWRMEREVPLLVPEVNAHALNGEKIIANPNCSTIQMVVALKPLQQDFKLKRVVVSTYQAVSGSGKKALDQLHAEIEGRPVELPAYPHQIAYNCLPHIDIFFEDGYSREEIKMIQETRKILELPNLPITATTVRVPVVSGHSESVNIEFEDKFELAEIRDVLSNSPGIVVMDNPENNEYPMPLYQVDQDAVYIGRIRRDNSLKNGLNLWIVTDNLRKGAATNAVQIAELLI